MKINTLHIKDFKNLKDVEFDFTNQKVILFLGETGNGKSSVFDALAYVLTDSLDEKLSEYIRWGQKEFVIECSFTHLNNTYEMSITGGKTTKKKLIINDNDEYVNSEASKKLAEIVDPVLTKYSAISTQGQSTQLLFDTPSNRLKKLREILKIDKVINASDNIREDIKIEKEKLDKIQAEIKLLEGLTFIYMDLPKLEDIDKIENEFKLLQENKKQFDSKVIIFNQYVNDLKKYNESQIKIKDLQLKIIDIQSDKKESILKIDIIFDEDELHLVSNEINKLEIDKVKYEQTIKDYETYVKQKEAVSENIKSFEKQLDRIKILRIKPASHNEEQIKDIFDKINILNVDNKDLNNKLKLANSGKCPTCEQPYVVNKENILSGIEKNNKDLKILMELHSSALLDKKRFEDETKEQDKLRQQKQSIYEKIDMLQKQLDSLTEVVEPEDKDFISELEILRVKKSNLDFDRKESNSIKEYNQRVILKLNALEVQIKAYQEQISDFILIKQPEEISEPIFDIGYYNNIKLNIDLYKQRKDEYDNVVNFNKKLKENEDTTKDKINVLTDSIQKIRSDIRILEESKTLIEKSFSGWLIEKGSIFIKEKMNSFFQRSYGRYNISLGQDKSSVDFFYSDGVHKETPCGMASGFEKQIISVANRVALSKLQSLNILMVDEADSESSEIRSEAMFKMLLDENFNQIFVISHKSNTQEYLSNTNNSGVYEISNGELLN